MRHALILLPVLSLATETVVHAEAATPPSGAVPASADSKIPAAAPLLLASLPEGAARPRVDAEAQKTLIQAAAAGDERAVFAAVRNGGALEGADEFGLTGLMAAARAGQTGMVEVLAARGVALDARDTGGKTALMWAVDARNLGAVDALLKAGADVNAQTESGATAVARLCAGLQYMKDTPAKPAAIRDTDERRAAVSAVLVALLHHGANPNIGGGSTAAPLVLAARYGETAVVNMLLASGADPEGRRAATFSPDAIATKADPYWETPLQAVLAGGNRARAEAAMLSDGGAMAVSLRDKLMATAQAEDLTIVKALLAAGSQVNQGMNRYTLLDAAGGAASAGTSLELVKLLAANGASLRSSDVERRLALMEAIQSGRVRLVMAPEAGTPQTAEAQSTAVQPVTMGPLARPALTASSISTLSGATLQLGPYYRPGGAASAASRRLAVSGIAAGPLAVPRATLVANSGPSQYWSYTSVARLVPPAPAQDGAKGEAGGSTSGPRTATEALSALDDRYGPPSGRTPLIEAARAGQVDVVAYLLQQGADANEVDVEGKTALMHVCGAGRTKWVRGLPSKRAESLVGVSETDPRLSSRVVSYSEKQGWREWAEQGDMAIVKCLVKAGASLEAKDQRGRTPLMYAARRSNPEVVRTLVELGADVNCRDNVGNTALMQVIGGGRFAGAEDWVSPVLRAEANTAMKRAHDQPGYGTTQAAAEKLDTYRFHRDLVLAEAVRDDSLILSFLRKSKTDLQITDKQGHTALQLAISAGQEHAVRWLMGS